MLAATTLQETLTLSPGRKSCGRGSKSRPRLGRGDGQVRTNLLSSKQGPKEDFLAGSVLSPMPRCQRETADLRTILLPRTRRACQLTAAA
jgi:hypothetical protein